MKFKNIIIGLTGVLLIFALFILAFYILKQLLIAEQSFKCCYLTKLGAYVIIGMILGFCTRVIYDFKKSGVWRVDLYRLIIWGIPFTIFASAYLIYFNLNIPVINTIAQYMVYIGEEPVAVSQTILGYILVSSFYKKEENEKAQVQDF